MNRLSFYYLKEEVILIQIKKIHLIVQLKKLRKHSVEINKKGNSKQIKIDKLN